MLDASHLAIADTLSKIAIAIIGGAWTALTYVRGRTFRRRLELKITGQIFSKGNVDFLSIDAAIKNVGLSRAVVFQEGTWLRIFRVQMKPDARSLALPREQRLATAPIFEKHGWIEPGEEVHDVLLVQLPQKASDDVAIRLSLRVLSQEWRWPNDFDTAKSGTQNFSGDWENQFWRNLEWNVESIVPLEVLQSPNASQPDPRAHS